MEARPAADSRSILVRWMGVTDANTAGVVHGGAVVELCDEGAGVAAVPPCRGGVVPAGAGRMAFLHPVQVGELLHLSAMVNAAWRTSMEVGVRVVAESPLTGESRHTNSAYFTMVAVDEEGRPVAVPPLVAESPDEHRRAQEAELRRANRLAERDQIIDARGAAG